MIAMARILFVAGQSAAGSFLAPLWRRWLATKDGAEFRVCLHASAIDELRSDGQHEHQTPGEGDGSVDLEKAVLPEDSLVGTKVHGWPPVPSKLTFPPLG